MSNLAKNVQSWTFSMGRPLCPQISKLSICQRLSKNCECVLKLPKMAKKCQSLSRIVKSGKKKCQKLIDVAKVIQNCQGLAKKNVSSRFFFVLTKHFHDYSLLLATCCINRQWIGRNSAIFFLKKKVFWLVTLRHKAL